MKRTLAFSIAALALAACGGNDANDDAVVDSAAAVAPATTPDMNSGATTSTPTVPADSLVRDTTHHDSTHDTTSATPLPPR